ncbi:MAG: site-specific integrase [Candidatus Kaiserbacteria bacterium]|nr:site-specific integrase [Candidatus Kaiserbacteria bacterium]
MSKSRKKNNSRHNVRASQKSTAKHKIKRLSGYLRGTSTEIPIEVAIASLSRADISKAVLKDYSYHVAHFLDFANTTGFSPQTLREYKQHLMDRKDFSTNTARKKMIVARVLLKQLFVDDILPRDLTIGVRPIPAPKGHLRTGLTMKEMRKIATFVRNLPDNSESHRLRALVSLLLYHGLRIAEITRLDIEHFDRSGVLHVQGKGSSGYTTPVLLHKRAKKALLDHISASKIRDGALFPSRSNATRNNHRRMTSHGLRKILNRCFVEAGVSHKSAYEKTAEMNGEIKKYRRSKRVAGKNRRVTPHTARHGYVSLLARHFAGDLLRVAKLSRHASISTVEKYCSAVSLERTHSEAQPAFADIKI